MSRILSLLTGRGSTACGSKNAPLSEATLWPEEEALFQTDRNQKAGDVGEWLSSTQLVCKRPGTDS